MSLYLNFMNILLVCSYFGPETSVGVNRVNAFARDWLAMDCSIDVITMPYSDELPLSLQVANNLYVHQVSPWLWKKTKKTKKSNNRNSINTSVGYFSPIKKIFYWLKKNIFANYLDYRVLWWPKAALHANEICKRKKIDVILTSVPSYTAHSIGAYLKYMNPDVFWVADYRDLWSGNPIFPGSAVFRFIEQQHERFLLKKADLMVTINRDLADFLGHLHNRNRVLIISNGFDVPDLKAESDVPSSAPKKNYLSIVYTGTVLYGLQNPTPLFEALTNLIKRQAIAKQMIKVFFYGDASAIEATEPYNTLLHSGNIVLMGRVSRAEALKAQRDADMLLFLGASAMKGGTDVKGVMSGKIFEYLVSGTEVMGVGVRENMLVAELIQQAEVGAVYGNSIEKIEEKLIDFAKNGSRKINPNHKYLGQFDRKFQSTLLLNGIKQGLFQEKVRDYDL